MSAERLEYKVEDRSILLPFYRRWLVDPTLPLIPASLHPNTITHAGHFANLLGTAVLLAAYRVDGWPFVVATLLLQFYLWCDNADGAHARRTRQCSPLGEFLDHGLDILNTVYISYLTGMALGASPGWWVGVAILIPGAGAVTYWEQSQTGVFQLGMLNQIESLTVLSLALLVSALFGQSAWNDLALFGVTAKLAILLWCAVTILFGMGHGIFRVFRTGSPLKPIVPLLLMFASIHLAALTGTLPTIHAVAIASLVNIHFGMRMLTLRLRHERPRVELPLLLGAFGLLALVALHVSGGTLPALLPVVLVGFAVVFFGGQALLDARAGALRLERMTA